MPGYPHLFEQSIDFDDVQKLVRTHAMLGVPYPKMAKDGASQASAMAQAKLIADDIAKAGGLKSLEDKQIVALIAYMQRLGTDISKPPPTAEGNVEGDEPTDAAAPATPATPAAPAKSGGAH